MIPKSKPAPAQAGTGCLDRSLAAPAVQSMAQKRAPSAITPA